MHFNIIKLSARDIQKLRTLAPFFPKSGTYARCLGLWRVTHWRKSLNQNAYQAMPHTERLAKNLNLSLEALSKSIDRFRQDTVYSYIVDTVEYYEGRLYQTGSGPNFPGRPDYTVFMQAPDEDVLGC